MDTRLSAADYDVDRVISECITGNSVATERSYAVVLRSYCVFHGIEVDSCSAIDFTDTKVAVFLKDAGIRRLYSRSTEKTYCAALGAAHWCYWFSCGAESVAHYSKSLDGEYHLFFFM